MKSLKLKFILLSIIIIQIFSLKVIAQPPVLFVLPGSESYLAHRIYNLFNEFYRGNIRPVEAASVTKVLLNSYDYICILDEKVDDYGLVSLTIQTFFGNSRGYRSSGFRYNSNFRMVDMYKIQAIELAMNLIKDLDPNYFEELREVFEKLGKIDD